MLIKAYGLFWREDEVDWSPGQGKLFRLLGRKGSNLPGLRVADFRYQHGLYVLYGDYGPYYVGLTYTSLGKRLKDHRHDAHGGRWTRFSWFGFRKVQEKTLSDQTRMLAPLALKTLTTSPKGAIADVEALLIMALGCPANTNNMNFKQAAQWEQISEDDREHYLERIGK